MKFKNFRKTLTTLSMALILSFSFITNAQAIENTEDSSKDSGQEKVVYLTFDDGPGGKVTLQVLDTLKAENVPATFFVIGCQIKGQENTILRMKNEGHSIGLHSFSHNRGKLYCEDEGFLKEMIQDQETLYEVTGEKYNILRFPFGCNNQSYKLTQKLVDTLHENNFKIYDWNTDSGDGANHNLAPENIVRKACKSDDKDTIVILMHCTYINKNSAKALPSIIKYYKDKGYTFKAIDETTPELYKVSKK
ncbi:MAG: polysaccharide deacetylase [Clostridium sp.]|nr:polysaccharide deacetylase [Clostridium sp.]